MDPIIDKINEIEQAASRILDDAAKANRELDAAHEVRLRAADLEIEEDTERQIKELQQELQQKLEDEEKLLEAGAGQTLQQLETYYRENRKALTDSIYNSIIRK